MRYKIVRQFFVSNRKVTIRTGLTLEQAEKHCEDPETSSRTCTKAAGLARTRKYGAWFDGYSEIK